MFVGRGGLRRSTITGKDCVEVPYALRPDAWGRGYATEIALLAISERMAEAGIEPMSMEEIDREVKAVRAERRRHTGGR